MKTLPKLKGTVAATLSALLLATTAAHVAAQERAAAADPVKEDDKTQKVETITITTGTRTAKAVDKIPGAITVISREEVAHTLTLTEDATAVLARTVPGYSESSQALSNTQETLRGRIALRLFDGIPQTSPLREGNRSGTFTNMSIIDRIEVINGPSAAEGIGASGGIINYITRTPTKNGNETIVSSRYTSEGHDDSEGWRTGLTFSHKEDAFDLLMAASFSDRGMAYDAHGRRVGMNASGSVNDSEEKNLFIKFGTNFGANGEQRLSGSISRFNLRGKGDYIEVLGNRAIGLTDTSEKGKPLNGQTEFNEFNQYGLAYNHSDLFGGALNINAYKASQGMRFVSENGSDKQDPLIAPLGTLVDQSEIHSEKKGVRSSWSTGNLAGVNGLELNAGVDVVQDTTAQFLALTNRLWVPPMTYKSTAPFAQLSYNAGPLTVSGGFRREDGQLSVSDYTTTYFRNRVFVTGGTLDYKANLPNIGVVWRLPAGWSAFASYSKGFSLPNVGIPLRNVNTPGQSVAGILDLQAVIVNNKEVGFNWRGNSGSFSGSVYRSYSEFGVSLLVDPITKDFVMRRQPVEITGGEMSGEYIISKTLKVGALYSRIRGMTVAVDGGPLIVQQGIANINPDKLGGSVTWKFDELGSVRLGSTTLRSRDINIGKSSEEHTHGYTLFDLSATYDLKKYGTVSLGIDNLTNKFYILSWSQLDFFQNYFAGRGRTVSLTHSIKF